MTAVLYKIHCDLFEDQSEAWPADLLLLPRPTVESMRDILIEQLRRKLATEGVETKFLRAIPDYLHVVPVLEGDEARRYLAGQEAEARARGDWDRARRCVVLALELEMTAGGRRISNGLSFEAGVDCQPENEWCQYPEPHEHGGFACDRTCPCQEVGGR